MFFCSEVVGNGLWLAPGDSEEVGVALVQALRNSIERLFVILVSFVWVVDIHLSINIIKPSFSQLFGVGYKNLLPLLSSMQIYITSKIHNHIYMT